MDFYDLFRNIEINLKKENVSDFFLKKLIKLSKNINNDIQYQIDKKKLSSEVHIVLKKG